MRYGHKGVVTVLLVWLFLVLVLVACERAQVRLIVEDILAGCQTDGVTVVPDRSEGRMDRQTLLVCGELDYVEVDGVYSSGWTVSRPTTVVYMKSGSMFVKQGTFKYIPAPGTRVGFTLSLLSPILVLEDAEE